jgi:hypothetical protein
MDILYLVSLGAIFVSVIGIAKQLFYETTERQTAEFKSFTEGVKADRLLIGRDIAETKNPDRCAYCGTRNKGNDNCKGCGAPL